MRSAGTAAARLGRWQRRDLELVAARLHGLQRAVEHDLEGAELLVAVVLGLVAQATGLVLGLLDGAAGRLLRGPHDLGALQHALGPHRCGPPRAVAAA